MKTNNPKLYVLPWKNYLIIIVIFLILANVDSLNLFKKTTKAGTSINTEKKLKKQINIDIHISANKKIRVNNKLVKLSDFKKVILQTTNSYTTQEVSGFIYNVYAAGTIKKGFISDLFEIIENTQDYDFTIKQVLHPYK